MSVSDDSGKTWIEPILLVDCVAANPGWSFVAMRVMVFLFFSYV